MVTLPAVVQAQFDVSIIQGALIITGYTGPGGAVIIPETINGLPVTGIGSAFYFRRGITSVSIPNNVTNIGFSAFTGCFDLTNVTIGTGLANIGEEAFGACTNLTSIYFQGDAPGLGSGVFFGDMPVPWPPWHVQVWDPATIYYLPGTTGWGSSFGNLPTSPWYPQVQTNAPYFGVRKNQFGFIISWASSRTVVVEACTNLVNPAWFAVATNTFTGGLSYFTDAQWTNYPARFYRIRSP
jgi:hypothetical protein